MEEQTTKTPSVDEKPFYLKYKLPVQIISWTLTILLLWWGYNSFFANKQGKACTKEAKICPDGSSVGRTGPNCEFAPCPTPQQPTPTPIDETANWKTYRNTVVGFEVKSPERFLSPALPGGFADNFLADGTEKDAHVLFGKTSDDSFGIRFFPFAKGVDDLIKTDEANAFPPYNWEGLKNTTTTRKPIIVNNSQALMVVANYSNSNELPFTAVFLTGENYGFMFTFSQNFKQDEIDQILSTFKFTE